MVSLCGVYECWMFRRLLIWMKELVRRFCVSGYVFVVKVV